MPSLSRIIAIFLIGLIVSPFTMPLSAFDLGDLLTGAPHGHTSPQEREARTVFQSALGHVLPGVPRFLRTRRSHSLVDHQLPAQRAALSPAAMLDQRIIHPRAVRPVVPVLRI